MVDDNEANRSLARHTLEDEGYRVLSASGGEEAIAMVQREAPDCILLDVQMPGLNGFAVCERLRALPQGADTPVVFLTALRDVETFDQALRAGGDDFLTKPVRPTELVIRVQSALKLRRLSAEVREHYDLLKRQRDGMVRLQLQKERLMAFVVHDLKNPVNAMDLHAQLLTRDRTLGESARESAAQIRSTARQLNRMILNLLDISKADEGKLTAKRDDIDLRALVDAIDRRDGGGRGQNAASRSRSRSKSLVWWRTKPCCTERWATSWRTPFVVMPCIGHGRPDPGGTASTARSSPPRRGRGGQASPSRCANRSSTRSYKSRGKVCRPVGADGAWGSRSAGSRSKPTAVPFGLKTRAPAPSSP